MKDIKSYIPEWETLRIIGNSKIVSATIFVPFIGYLILFNNELIMYFTLAKELLQYPDNPASITNETISRLYYLYYGLTVLGVASIIFTFICPPIVKGNKNEYEYLNNEIKIKSYPRMHSFVMHFQKNLDKDSKEHKELQAYLSRFNSAWDNAQKECGGEGYEIVLRRTNDMESEAYLNVLGFNWKHHTKSMMFTRLFLTVVYTVGFLLVLYPSLQVFYKISTIIYNKI